MEMWFSWTSLGFRFWRRHHFDGGNHRLTISCFARRPFRDDSNAGQLTALKGIFNSAKRVSAHMYFMGVEVHCQRLFRVSGEKLGKNQILKRQEQRVPRRNLHA